MYIVQCTVYTVHLILVTACSYYVFLQRVDWCMLLLRLVQHPAVDNTGLGEGILFYSIVDMLATIVETVETFCSTSEETTPKIINFRKLCNEIWEVESLINKQVCFLLIVCTRER